MREVADSRSGWFGRLRRRVGDEVLAGIAVVTVVVLALGTTAAFYLWPPAQKEISFFTTDAAAVSTGTDVRVAGVSIGQVSAVEFAGDEVRVRARIKDSVFVGDQSRVEVRMLTPVGGFAVSLIPLGSQSLSGPIARQNVSVPYTIADVLQVAPKVTDEVQGEPFDANLTEVAEAMARHPESIADIAGGAETLSRILDRQEEQVRSIMALSAEYLQKFEANRDFVFDLVRQIDIVVQTYHVNSAGFNEAYALLGDVLMRIQPFEEYYLDNADFVAGQVENLRQSIAGLDQTMGPALDSLLALRGRLADWLTPAGIAEIGAGLLSIDDFCLPAVGKDC